MKKCPGKFFLSLALSIAMLMTGILWPTLAEEPLAIVEAKAIAETLPEGQTVTGVRIEYPGQVVAGTVSISTYAVSGYSVIGVYTNDSGTPDDAQARGKYVFLKLAYSTIPGYSMGKTLQYTGGINHLREVHLDIRQNANVTLADERVVNASGFTNTGTINVLVDDFLPITFTNPEDGTTVSYRLFIPEGYDIRAESQEPLPLVLFLHGAGESGTNNISQILGNPSALEFANARAQAKHPCFVLAAQKTNEASHGWAMNSGTKEQPFFEASYILKNLKLAIDGLMEDYAIDGSRMYCTGLSMGGRGTFAMNIAYPDMFAAMLVVASCDIYTDEQLQPLTEKAIWLLLAADETEERITNMGGVIDQLEKLGAKVIRRVDDQAWNGFARGYQADLLAREQIAEGANVLLTHYLKGTVVPSSHWSWMATYNNDAIRDWLFDQQLDTPYTPAR
ncbi:MAG TPA: PHB depolymerase family esterase [Clostridia bacterium]|nr:PHB depolymerase family esterase [Clostridia bacterium]HPY42922.1 PHB depolymerase family esterase [Clostridia bacterium]HQA96474.1 PHB depolymerase family esterase [Clostridia bacterium]HQO55045.1 PHB depolymerase family esterase [Clostridia bacterium]HUM60122.1 PHB depolymerase family esterase [Clostridia bacterium]